MDERDFERDKPYELSARQQRFVEECRQQCIDVDYGYSGRSMMGRMCPAARVDYISDLETKEKPTVDNMGMGYVLYVR